MKSNLPHKPQKKVNYINNKDLFLAMVDFLAKRKEAITKGEQTPPVTRYIGQSIQQIANGIASRDNFSSYTFKEDMVGDGVENCIQYLHNFNPEKSQNPFSYLSLIIWNAFIRRIKKERIQSYVKHKLMFDHSVLTDSDRLDPNDARQIKGMLDSMNNEKSQDIISSFEKSQRDEKLKKLKKKEEADVTTR